MIMLMCVDEMKMLPRIIIHPQSEAEHRHSALLVVATYDDGNLTLTW